MIPDLFAGPGGWDEGARLLGVTDVVGLESDHDACRTAVAAGHKRIRTDVAAYPPHPFDGTPGLIASPPCQAWSRAGKGGGEHDRAACHEYADRIAGGDDSTSFTDWTDPRSALVCEPIRWVRDLRPEWVALEEVPAVLGLWEHFARILGSWGYSTYVAVLNAADYGVPQKRTRAILGASRVRRVTIPPATHARDAAPSLFGERSSWLTMSDAVGWDASDVIRPARGAGMVRRHGSRPDHPASQPAPTVISKTRSWSRLSSGGVRARVTVEEAGVLQSFPRGYPWHGSWSSGHEQVGNAVPPRLAAHVLQSVIS